MIINHAFTTPPFFGGWYNAYKKMAAAEEPDIFSLSAAGQGKSFSEVFYKKGLTEKMDETGHKKSDKKRHKKRRLPDPTKDRATASTTETINEARR